jgi:hypothetical protein
MFSGDDQLSEHEQAFASFPSSDRKTSKEKRTDAWVGKPYETPGTPLGSAMWAWPIKTKVADLAVLCVDLP